MKRGFWGNIPDDCKKAISELNRLKVSRCMAYDYEETFADVWWLALHEVDLWAEGEDRESMNRQQARRADEWLIRWLPLFNKYKTGNFGKAPFRYTGQIL